MSSYSLKQATRKDIPEILNIAESHYYTFGPQGFLVSKYNYEIISKKMNNPNSIVYVTKNENDEVISFLILTRIFHNLKMNGLLVDDFILFDESDKKILTSFKHFHMEQGAVRKDYLHKGVGSFYYKELFNKYSDHSFSSNVISKPVNNRASIKIKYKFGFEEAGKFSADEYKDIKDFEMILFIKKAQNTQEY